MGFSASGPVVASFVMQCTQHDFVGFSILAFLLVRDVCHPVHNSQYVSFDTCRIYKRCKYNWVMNAIVKILIAEDDAVIGENYNLMLKSRNHEVTLTHDGAECISVFEAAFNNFISSSSLEAVSPFDVVVLDSRMPRKSGIDVAKHMLGLCPRQRIIFATAHTMDTLDGLRKKINLGIEVLQKPFDLDAFVDMVEDFGPKPSVAQNE